VCKKITERILKHNPNKYTCTFCGETADKLVSAASFKINGYSEANGYSKMPGE
jgi:hypothetical protein